ncbi:MAG: flagellar protein FlaG [Clostridiaceae bacterium]|nr:flagellar protein FlaG [Clostridiaceae bacterium]
MKINSNQTGPNIIVVTKKSTDSRVQEQKPVKKPEPVKDTVNKPASETKEEPGLNEKQLIEAIEKTNKSIEGTTCSLKYSLHDSTKQIMVKVIDNETKEVIKEFPPEKILDMVAKMWEVAGIMVDERR